MLKTFVMIGRGADGFTVEYEIPALSKWRAIELLSVFEAKVFILESVMDMDTLESCEIYSRDSKVLTS